MMNETNYFRARIARSRDGRRAISIRPSLRYTYVSYRVDGGGGWREGKVWTLDSRLNLSYTTAYTNTCFPLRIISLSGPEKFYPLPPRPPTFRVQADSHVRPVHPSTGERVGTEENRIGNRLLGRRELDIVAGLNIYRRPRPRWNIYRRSYGYGDPVNDPEFSPWWTPIRR